MMNFINFGYYIQSDVSKYVVNLFFLSFRFSTQDGSQTKILQRPCPNIQQTEVPSEQDFLQIPEPCAASERLEADVPW
jgi:hypothetical protein